MTKIAVGMSGGVDSSVAAALLIERGFEVSGLTLKLCTGICAPTSDAKDAANVCSQLGINHFTHDFSEDFRSTVVKSFVSDYFDGKTPNPCIECNKHIKFGAMLSLAKDELGCDKIATGHYAQIKKENGRFLLYRASDRAKDQSYVLYGLTQSQLAATEFPLGALSKSQIREIARELSLKIAERPDSQDICFVPDGDYAAFIEGYASKTSPKGNFIGEDGKILGEHQGIIRYTVGQRKGLGIALGSPAYVLSKDPKFNTVTLSTDENRLFYKRVEIESINLIAADSITDGTRVEGKLRYRHGAQPARLFNTQNGRMIIEFDKPQRAPASGQAAVFYDGDTVIGGGTIVKGVD